jgi:L-lactate dehydrogenase complex protein LldE
MNVQIFIPCFVDQLYPEVGMNMVKILEKVGCKVSYNPNQTCCGQPAFNAGFMKEAKAVSEKFIHDFSGDEIIVAPSGSCIGYVRGCFEEIFDNSSNHNEAKAITKRSFELTEFLVDILKIENLGSELNAIATYHDACGALRECGIKSGPRKLLANVKGLELREMKECETCCGFGGTFAVKYEPISIGMSQTKVQSALEVGAEYIISTDVSCLMHLDGYIKHEKLPIKTAHIANILAMGL